MTGSANADSPSSRPLSEKDITSGLLSRWYQCRDGLNPDIATLEAQLSILSEAGSLALGCWEKEFADERRKPPSPEVRTKRRDKVIVDDGARLLEDGGKRFELYRAKTSGSEGQLARIAEQAERLEKRLGTLSNQAISEATAIKVAIAGQTEAITATLPEGEAGRLKAQLETHIATLASIQQVLTKKAERRNVWQLGLVGAKFWGFETLKLLAAIAGAVLVMKAAAFVGGPLYAWFHSISETVSHEAENFARIGQSEKTSEKAAGH